MQTKEEKLYTVSKNQSGADCGSDHELLIPRYRLLLKKVGKTTRQFRYDLNQIPYNYVVEVIKEIQGNKSDRMPEELWAEVGDIVQETVIKTIPPKKEMQKRQNGFLRRPHQ